MHRILQETGTSEYKAYISGPDNFRYSVDPSYKANRTDQPRPEWLQPVREHLVVQWGAIVSDGIEADDNLGIEQTDDTVICSIDKDLLQIPGQHYNFVKCEASYVTPHQGWINFYHQLIMGDKSDNIMGYDGKMRQAVPKFLQPILDQITDCECPLHMWQTVHDYYELGEEALFKNAQLLYILRNHDEYFQIPV